MKTSVETVWLIEGDPHYPPAQWIRLIERSVNGRYRTEIGWTEDSSLALRFARKIDARAFALLHPEECTLATITKHVFSW